MLECLACPHITLLYKHVSNCGNLNYLHHYANEPLIMIEIKMCPDDVEWGEYKPNTVIGRYPPTKRYLPRYRILNEMMLLVKIKY